VAVAVEIQIMALQAAQESSLPATQEQNRKPLVEL
jgi:hypothetical protein